MLFYANIRISFKVNIYLKLGASRISISVLYLKISQIFIANINNSEREKIFTSHPVNIRNFIVL